MGAIFAWNQTNPPSRVRLSWHNNNSPILKLTSSLRKKPNMRALWTLTFLSLLSGCTHIHSNNHISGRMWNASKTALANPSTWVPLTGAALFVATNSDHETSDWAVENKPLYSTWEKADDASNRYNRILSASALLSSVLLHPRHSNHSRWDRLMVDASTVIMTNQITSALQETIKRSRPRDTIQSKDTSFPSGHSSQAFSTAAITSENLKLYRISKTKKVAINIGVYTLAYGTAWARIEAEHHYPSDVLAGAALGNFFAIFMREMFLKEKKLKVTAQLSETGGTELNVSYAF